MMKSFLFLFPERERRQQQQQSDEEEGTALVPTPQPAVDDDHGGGADLHAEDDEDPAAAVKQQKTKQLLDDDDQTTTTTTGDGGTASSSASKAPAPAWWRRRAQKLLPTRSVGLVIGGLVVLALLIGSTGSWWIHLDVYASSSFLLGGGGHHRRRPPHRVVPKQPAADLVPIPFSCGGNGSSSTSGTCHRRSDPSRAAAPSPSPSPSSAPPQRRPDDDDEYCPEYFRFIHSDLSPWRSTGISREAVERGRRRAAFRLVVVGGRAYVETYHRVFQTRDTFTQWGIAQLLARYPGRVPDLDLMFNCEDMPEVRRAADAPPLFRYCKDDSTVDIVFPDWSFWGWPEVNIRPWSPLLEEMAAQMSRLPWPDREPYAYWKGNPGVSRDRAALLRRCNDTTRWNARLFAQDWGAAIRAGFRGSNLAEQCTYRYKIYVRGRSWSVSEKYILACDSPVLLLDTPFKDFFSRGLVAGRHYWPIDPARDTCAAIKFAVDWGNAHPAEARRMAEEGSGFARDDLAMDYVYDYMLHLLTEYAKLLRYRPTVPDKAVELCPEAVACAFPEHGSRERAFMMESREKYVAAYEPCTLPPPFTDHELEDMAARDRDVRAKVANMMAHHH